MPRHLIDVGDGRPLLDIASYARLGPARRDRLSRGEIELIARTVGRAPEVIVKVLSRGGRDLRAVRRHLAYLNRGGELEIDTDDGQRLSGRGIEKQLLDDWDLDVEEQRSRAELEPRSRATSPKLVHKILFSMPAGTPAGKVLAAVKNFAREEFGLKHRYALILHTDEPHPHVHAVVKAVSEQGVRLHIRKATLRTWRREFARHLHAQGVEANATERAVRGERRTHKLDGIYRAGRRGASTHVQARTATVSAELVDGALRQDSGRSALIKTRKNVLRGWHALSDILLDEGRVELAARARRFAEQMPPVQTEKEAIAAALLRERGRPLPVRSSR